MITINMYEKYDDIINIRSKAENIFDNIPKNTTEVCIDFKNIAFMGRSFTQEYYRQIKDKNIKVIEINKNKDIDAMIKAVFKS
ncbi:MAG: arginase family protein [Methanosphaera stadtmanae]|nr:arginase family protein [Methanosphaera stadtmanae]